ncbi:MAG TPA: indole-3-glycerol-phosphate synthase [Gammaproteobacteria bacterium]|nr:indole-3-glycerol-phosphate synthase [Gammaproteobacteria bacterium]
MTSKKSFKQSLQNNYLSIIAEIKRRSPSKGDLAEIIDPTQLAETYIQSGANAISVLTNTPLFCGSLEDLKKVADHNTSMSILRKDFITDFAQIDDAIKYGANAVLLIVANLGEKTKVLLEYAKSVNLDALVEVHTEAEVELALNIGSEIIGINNRNLKTFYVDTHRALELKKIIPKDIITVAESGILNSKLARDYYKAGFNAVLIGEALVTSKNPAEFIRACRHE